MCPGGRHQLKTQTEQVLQLTLLLSYMYETKAPKMHLNGVVQTKMVKMINFLFFVQKVSSGSGALCPKFLLFRGLVALEPPKNGGKGGQNLAFCIVYFHYLLIYSSNT